MRPATPIPYAAYIAPALLAVSAMNGAIYDSTWNVFFKMNFGKLYEGMLATSLGPLDVALGEISLALLRGGATALGFLLVMQVARAQPRRGRRSSRCPRCCSSRSGSRASAWGSPAT